MVRPTDYVVIADPQSLRWKHYQQALEKIGLPLKLHLLPWHDVIQRDGDIGLMLPETPSLLRVESPGRDFSLVQLTRWRPGTGR